MKLQNISGKSVQVLLNESWAIVPQSQQLPQRAPAAKVQVRTESKRTVFEQVCLVGPVVGRGGLVGRQLLTIEPGQITELKLPLIATSLRRFRPESAAEWQVRYRLVPVEQWTDNASVLRFVRFLSQRGASRGVAQAALWHLWHRVSFRELVWYKPGDCNKQEAALAEALVAQLGEVGAGSAAEKTPQQPPCCVYLQIINKAGQPCTQLTDQMRSLADRGGLFGLPVQLTNPEEADLRTLAELRLAVGCQITLLGPPEQLRARVLFSVFNGQLFGPWPALPKRGVEPRYYDVYLGAHPQPSEALTLIEGGTISKLVPVSRPQRDNSPPVARVQNLFPLSLHACQLVPKKQRRAPPRSITLTGYAIGPGRSLELPWEGPVDEWEVRSASWGY